MSSLSLATIIFGAGGLISGIVSAAVALINVRRSHQSQLIETAQYLSAENKRLNQELDERIAYTARLERENTRLKNILNRKGISS